MGTRKDLRIHVILKIHVSVFCRRVSGQGCANSRMRDEVVYRAGISNSVERVLLKQMFGNVRLAFRMRLMLFNRFLF